MRKEFKGQTEFHEGHSEVIFMDLKVFYAFKGLPSFQPHRIFRCPEANYNLKFTHDIGRESDPE